MGSSRNGRFRQRSKICDSGFNELSSYDGALSKAIWGNRFNALTRIWPFLDDEPEEVISLKKQLQHLKNKLKEQEEKYENLRKEQEEKCENLQSQVADFNFRVVARELVKNFKAGSYSQIDKLLMDKARERFPEEFPIESRVLKDLELLLGPKWRCTQKFWNLLILAYKFPKDASWKNFGELMKMTYSQFPKEFTWKSFEDLMKIVLKNSVFRARYEKLKEKLSNEDLYNLMKLERVFYKASSRKKFEDLMEKALHLFHEVLPQEYLTDRYTVMVAILVNRFSILKDEKLLDIDKRKLDCLRDVATKFQWSNENKRWTDEGFGKQFFLLCKYVAESNRDVFHPELKGPRGDEFVKRTSKGLFKIDGMDVGPLAIELFNMDRLS